MYLKNIKARLDALESTVAHHSGILSGPFKITAAMDADEIADRFRQESASGGLSVIHLEYGDNGVRPEVQEKMKEAGALLTADPNYKRPFGPRVWLPAVEPEEG